MLRFILPFLVALVAASPSQAQSVEELVTELERLDAAPWDVTASEEERAFYERFDSDSEPFEDRLKQPLLLAASGDWNGARAALAAIPATNAEDELLLSVWMPVLLYMWIDAEDERVVAPERAAGFVIATGGEAALKVTDYYGPEDFRTGMAWNDYATFLETHAAHRIEEREAALGRALSAFAASDRYGTALQSVIDQQYGLALRKAEGRAEIQRTYTDWWNVSAWDKLRLAERAVMDLLEDGRVAEARALARISMRDSGMEWDEFCGDFIFAAALFFDSDGTEISPDLLLPCE